MIQDPEEALGALLRLVEEMEQRDRFYAEGQGSRGTAEYSPPHLPLLCTLATAGSLH